MTFGREPPGQTPPQDPNIPSLETTKTRIRDSINTARDLLARMTTATLHPVPTSTHVGYIIKMTHLTYAVDIDLMETKPTCRDLNDMEIRNFSTSMIDISHRASTFYTSLSTRLDPADAARVLVVNRILQTAIHNVQREVCHVKKGTTEKAKCIYMNIKLDHKYLLDEVMEHNYLTAEDHIIIHGMKLREGWKETMDKITRSHRHPNIRKHCKQPPGPAPGPN